MHTEIVKIPFAILAYDEGLDGDGMGNFWQGSPPEWFLLSAYRSRIAAEMAICWIKHIQPDFKVRIQEDYICSAYDAENKWEA